MTKTILYLDPIGGVAGDMFSAAFLDAGAVGIQELQKNVSLVVPEIKLKAEKTIVGGIQGTRLHVISPQGAELPGVPHSNAWKGHHHHHEHDHHPYKDIRRRFFYSKFYYRHVVERRWLLCC